MPRVLPLLGLLAMPLSTVQAQTPLRLPAVAGLDEFVPIPAYNPLTVEARRLGERLFFEARLSRDGSISCATCHQPALAFADTSRISRGVGGRIGRRNTPSLINRGYGTSQFRDGRARSLEEAVLQPIRDTREMALPISVAIARLRRDSTYTRAFREAYGGPVSTPLLARALATYVRTLRAGDAPADRYERGDALALSAEARRGLALFRGAARCARCHLGATFGDEAFHNTGVAAGPSGGDSGRANITGRAADRGAFRTPSLRDVSRTAPYMHDGSLPTLEAVVDFYADGGRANPSLDRDMQPLPLTVQDRRDLVAFLRALDSNVFTTAPVTQFPSTFVRR